LDSRGRCRYYRFSGPSTGMGRLGDRTFTSSFGLIKTRLTSYESLILASSLNRSYGIDTRSGWILKWGHCVYVNPVVFASADAGWRSSEVWALYIEALPFGYSARRQHVNRQLMNLEDQFKSLSMKRKTRWRKISGPRCD
jgi:hypothetical protein